MSSDGEDSFISVDSDVEDVFVSDHEASDEEKPEVPKEVEDDIPLEGELKLPPQNQKAVNIHQVILGTNGIPVGWNDLFQKQMPYLVRLSKGLESQGMDVYPNIWEIFTAYHLVPRQWIDIKGVRCLRPLIKVVIVGQDPYYTETGGVPTAMGMSFSVRKGHKVPPSLVNIFKRMKDTGVISKVPISGDLSRLAREGVFFFNSALTMPRKRDWESKNTTIYRSGLHVRQWKGWAEATIEYLAQANPRAVFMLWGKDAQEVESKIPNTCLILKCSHPSPQSFKNAKEGFFEMNHFVMANEHYKEMNQKGVNWEILNQ